MDARKSMVAMLMESTMDPKISSPLRRKSIAPIQLSSVSLSENDDEAERLARRREIRTSTASVGNSISNEKRRSLGLAFLAHMSAPQIAERISECIKLSTENKINTKNAFSLEMIDFMTYMVKKQDVNMANLQVASTSLDVSTKIYGFRVDGIHTEILKMIGGLDKQEKVDEVSDTQREDGSTEENTKDSQEQSQLKKKKKRNKQKIFSTVDALRGNIEIGKPTSMMIGEGDSQTSDMLFQASLPNHAISGFYLHQYNDVIVDTITQKNTQNKSVENIIPRINDFSHLQICPTFSNFEFQGWSADDESEEDEMDDPNRSNFQFDLDASLPLDNDPTPSGVNYFDIEDEQENVERCIRDTNKVENIIDFREVVTATAPVRTLEYSFVQKNINIHWAGPSHWKIRDSFKTFNGNSKIMETCRQAPTKKRKEIELLYNAEIKKAVENKFTPSVGVKLQAKTAKTEWQEDKLTLPEDVHYDISQGSKLYLHSLICVKPSRKDQLNATHVSEDIENYDYNNENDTSEYCPAVNNEECQGSEDNNNDGGFRSEDDCMTGTQTGFVGDNLVAIPKLANKISIAYCTKPKKIDMRQLKKSIWKCLTSDNDKENINIPKAVEQEREGKIKEKKHFSTVYKTLPKILTKNNTEALSFPVAFVSLLHLANEKELKISSIPDMSDLVVEN